MAWNPLRSYGNDKGVHSFFKRDFYLKNSHAKKNNEFTEEVITFPMSLLCAVVVQWFVFCALCPSSSSHSEAGPRRKLYSAVPGRHFVVVRPYTPQAEGEINLYKADRVKGNIANVLLTCSCLLCNLIFVSGVSPLLTDRRISEEHDKRQCYMIHEKELCH